MATTTSTTSTTSSSSLGTVSSLGVGSGLDLDSLLESLQEVEEQKVTVISNKITAYEAKATAYTTLSSALTTLSEATEKLSSADIYNSKTVSTNTAFTATATSSATAGTYSVYVTQLATAQSLVSATQSSKSDALSSSASTLTITVGSTSTDISLSADNTSLTGLVSAINGANAGVTASIIQSGDSSYQLVVTSNTTGEASTVTLSSTDDTLNSIIGTDAMTEAVAAQDAIVSVNGVTVTRSSNTITDVPSEGVTLTLTAESTSKETLSITASTDDLTDAINDWVDAYNSLLTTFATLTAYTDDDDSTNDGALLSDSVLRGVKNKLKSLVNSTQSGDYSVLSQLGINFSTSTGRLTVDDDALSEALSSNSSGVKEFFMGNGTTTGLATQMISTIETYTDEKDGIIANAQDGITEILDRLETRKTAAEARVAAVIARYTTQFTALDVLIAKLDSTSSYLENAFDQLNSD